MLASAGDMQDNLPKEKIELFDRLIKSLGVAISNCALYPPGHPSFQSSIGVFKESLDKWQTAEGDIEIGVSPDNILLNGDFVRKGNQPYKDVADYLHKRGIVAVSFAADIEIEELYGFFTVIRTDLKTFYEKGGISKNLAKTQHLTVKEVDYSALLTSVKAEGGMDENKMWQSLSSLTKELRGGRLPDSKAEFLRDFLKDKKRSAAVLNRIYRDAISKVEDQAMTEDVREAFSRINKHLWDTKVPDAGGANKELSDIVLNLDPGLIASLFADKGAEGGGDLSSEMFEGFSDDQMAEFISSLIQNGNGINENLLKLYNKLISGSGRSDNVMAMVTDKLFEKKLLDKNALSGLQETIKDLFNEHPENDFVTQIYKLTVDAFVEKGESPSGWEGEHSGLVRDYIEFLKADNMKKERLRLILNVLWLENNPEQFKKFCGILMEAFRDVLDNKMTESVRESFDLFTDKLRPNQLSNASIAEEAKEAFRKISGNDTIMKLLSLVPDANRRRLEDIADILAKRKEDAAGPLLDSYIASSRKDHRRNFGHVLIYLGRGVSAAIAPKIDEALSRGSMEAASGLYGILKAVDPAGGRSAAKKMLESENIEIRVQAIEDLRPETEDEKKMIFDMFKKEDDPDAKKKILAILVKSGNPDMIGRLFSDLGKGPLKNSFLPDLVKSCGDYKIKESVPHLGGLLEKKHFFYTRELNSVRLEAVVSLGRIGTGDAIAYIRKASADRSESVRKICKLILEAPARSGTAEEGRSA